MPIINKKPQPNNPAQPHYLGHRARVKEKFLKANSGNFADYELLEILLFSTHPRKDTKILAKKLVEKFGNINSLINSDLDLLKSDPEINENILVLVKIIKEIMERNFLQEISDKTIIDNSDALIKYCQIKFFGLKSEEFHVLFLDKKHQLIEDYQHNQGNVDHVNVEVEQIIKKGILVAAKSVILAHNHPSSHIEPSKNDILTTEKIRNSFKILNIRVLDHLIFGPSNQYYSFRDHGLL